MRTPHKSSILSLLMALCLALPAAAGEADEANLDILASTLQANKKAMVAVNLGLDDAEAKAFWPIYDRYESDLANVSDRLVKLIEDYTANFATMGDDKAMQIVEDFLALERKRAEVREKYLEPFSGALPGRKVARFYQIENKIHAVLRYALARAIPVVEQ